MSTVAEFIKTREHIEALATKITLLAERKAAPESKHRLDEANQHLDILKTMVANDVQVIVVDRLTRHLTRLGIKVDAIMAKKPVKRKPKIEA
ncbi:MAG: hypothetical protein NT178_06065 [Proteobacteria bacterium]|nr:hypothetical protein [Pseudomonadota bacterium]